MKSRWIFQARRAAAVTAVVLCTTAAYGCYVYEPTTASLLAPGKSVALDLNDLGRLSLASQIGPEVKRISGVLISQTSDTFVLHVSELTFFNGRESEWSGEAVSVRSDYVSTVLEEKLSASRTALAAAGAAGGVGALIAARSLIGNGGSSTDTKGTGTPPVNTYRGIQ